jgi:hypothetical protein
MLHKSVGPLRCGSDGGVRSRRQARDHVMDALYISCPFRPIPATVRSTVQVKNPDPALCSQALVLQRFTVCSIKVAVWGER